MDHAAMPRCFCLSARRAGGSARAWVWISLLSGLLGAAFVRGEVFLIPSSGGDIRVDVPHVGPDNSLTQPSAPTPQPFRPPAVFSAPLPSGSGARALAFAGCFTAIADDATAASWNPAGLIQLERPEMSFAVRYSRDVNRHASGDNNYQVGDDRFQALGLNYLSGVFPFQLSGCNFVFSANYQEVYDFNQSFHARNLQRSRSLFSASPVAVTPETRVDHIQQPGDGGGTIDVDVTSRLVTTHTSVLNQLLSANLVNGLDFEQSGVIDALSPALAVEITPWLALGVALNVYGQFGGNPLQSLSVARYRGSSASAATLQDVFTTTGTYTYKGTVTTPSGGSMPPIVIPIEGQGSYDPFTDRRSGNSSVNYPFVGVYSEKNSFDDLRGVNATLGVLYTVNRQLSLGATLDLPWTADAVQTKTVQNWIVSFDPVSGRLVDVGLSRTTESKDVSFDFPLYWAAGAVYRWTPSFFTALDVCQTRWSDFAFQAEGEKKVNPLDGTTDGEHPIKDCWGAHVGAEYLMPVGRAWVPLRCGFGWDQRPSIEDPDEYWSVSLGTGLSIGEAPGRILIDLAYSFSWANDVMGSLVSGQDAVTTDVQSHEVYLSCIVHF